MNKPDTAKAERFRAILGVGENATKKELKKAYHAKVARLHPDLHPNDPQAARAFKKVNAAYEYLKKHLAKAPATPGRDIPGAKNITAAPGAQVKTPRTSSPASTPDISLDDLIFRLRHSQNEYLRMHAVKAIEAAGGREAVWGLLPALNDSSKKVTAAAVAALGNMQARLAVVPLIQLFGKSSDEIDTLVIKSLEKIGSPLGDRFLEENNLSSRKTANGANPVLNSIANDLLNA